MTPALLPTGRPECEHCGWPCESPWFNGARKMRSKGHGAIALTCDGCGRRVAHMHLEMYGVVPQMSMRPDAGPAPEGMVPAAGTTLRLSWCLPDRGMVPRRLHDGRPTW